MPITRVEKSDWLVKLVDHKFRFWLNERYRFGMMCRCSRDEILIYRSD